jgi:uncharacterized protein (TIGR02646 family)
MRRITKGAAPLNVSPLGQQPRSLIQADADYQASRQTAHDPEKHARACFDSMQKKALRDLLFVEQRFLCVYCESTIDEVYPFPPVDHWNPLKHFLPQVFSWENLHLSCRGANTCDARKEDTCLNLPWPAAYAYEDVLGFTSGGWIYVRNDVPLPQALRDALELAIAEDTAGLNPVKSTLNLNHSALRAAREAAIDDEEEALGLVIGQGTASTPNNRIAHAAALLGQARRPQFVSIRVAAVLQTLGQGR